MTIRVEKLKYTNFEDEISYASVICFEDFNEESSTKDRSFIVFESFDEIEENLTKLLDLVRANRKEIHKSIGDTDKIEKLLDTKYIKITAFTHSYWSDVRLFSNSSRFNYADDVYDTSAIELALNKFIRNKYYNKERLETSCSENNAIEAIRILNQSQFKVDEIQDLLDTNSGVRKIFNTYNLHELLSNNLDPSIEKPKSSKI